MATQTGFWNEVIEGRCQALSADEPVIEAARLIGQALDLGLLTLPQTAEVKRMSGQQLEGWLCALAADVALAGCEQVTGGAA